MAWEDYPRTLKGLGSRVRITAEAVEVQGVLGGSHLAHRSQFDRRRTISSRYGSHIRLEGTGASLSLPSSIGEGDLDGTWVGGLPDAHKLDVQAAAKALRQGELFGLDAEEIESRIGRRRRFTIGLIVIAGLLAACATPAPAPVVAAAQPAVVQGEDPTRPSRQRLYNPQGEVPMDPALGMSRIKLATHDGQALTGFWRAPPDGAMTLLFFTGNGRACSRFQFRYERMIKAGLGVLCVNYRGYEGSTGVPAEDDIHADARDVFDWLAARVAPDRIVINGYSLGTPIAVRLATERRAHALVLEGSLISGTELDILKWGDPSLGAYALDPYPTRNWIGHILMPVLFVHGDADPTAPYDTAQQLYRLAPSPKSFATVKGGDHFNIVDAGGYDAVWRFLGLTVAQTTATPGMARSIQTVSG